ncbi:helix-turn-helix domain-containing protein [Desnuesiella massiliensis]|uniref:helix-turn-helix domain-containing protein n=1 Tax=Desnuesiella massiliensis TaxID=1650662 RepID=UPI0006E138DE|nr:helix-turn-helix transcriptional regulator [Desnuesiella massiliensis]
MKLAIGNKIKSLRKKRNLTQEQLGEHLGISFQSISKWENNIALPDITLVPKIATILGISIDELFDYDLKEINEKIKSICNETYECRWNDDFRKEKEILLEGLKDYPNNEMLLNNYLYTINYKENPEEVIAIAGKLVAETTDDTIKYNALRFLSYAYYTKGELEYAKATLEQIPELYFTKLSEMHI